MDRTEFTNYRSFRLGIIWFSGPEITNQIFLATTYLAYFKAFGHFLNKFLDFYIKQLFQNVKIFSKQKEAIVNRGCIFFGFQLFVKNEEKDGFLHEERLIVEEKMNKKLT